jgi:hypothetical protein
MAARTVSNTGGNWNTTATWVGGAVPIAGDDVNFTATSGPLTVNVSTANLIGINFTNYVGTIIFNNPINTTGTINLGTGGYIQAGPSGLALVNTNNITSNGVIWSRTLTFQAATFTTILNDALNVTGAILSTGGFIHTINGFSLYVGGNLSMASNGILGTTNLIFNGTGTWSNTGAIAGIKNNVTINTTGTLTIGANIYYNTGILTYITGNVDTGTNNSTLNIATTATLNTNGMIWNNIIVTPGTFTLTGNLSCKNFTAGGGGVTFNSSGGNIYILGNLLHNGGGAMIGTASINLIGTGTWIDTAANDIRNNLIINTPGTITMVGNIYYNTGTLTYINGSVITKNSRLTISIATTLVNCHKINFDRILITSGIIITMNEFFSGSPNLKTTISSTVATTNYTIRFQDGFEKISKFVNINNCTLSNPLQLLVTTNSPRSSTNKGIRYINQSPNGIAKNKPSVNVPMAYGVGGLLSDPNMK